jgi:hypothetical protein
MSTPAKSRKDLHPFVSEYFSKHYPRGKQLSDEELLNFYMKMFETYKTNKRVQKVNQSSTQK